MSRDPSSDGDAVRRRAGVRAPAVALALAVLVGAVGPAVAVGAAGVQAGTGDVADADASGVVAPGATGDADASRVGDAGATGVVEAVATGVEAVATAQVGAEPSFVVSLSAGGDADVALTLTYDLSTDEERAAFRSLQDDAAAREELAARFRDRLASVAAAAENRTGRSMAVHHPSASVSTTDGNATGVVVLRVVWEGLAAADGDRLVVTEPFASGFSPDRRFVVVGPEGYRVDSVSPPADERGDRRVAWTAGTSLDGFEAAFVAATTETPTAGGGDGGPDEGTPTQTSLPDGDGSPVPGFGPGVAGVALAAGALLAARRRG